MILDERNEFADAVALNTGAAGSYLIGDQIDLGVARDIGNGEPLHLVITVDTEIDAGAGGTVQLHLASDATAAIDPTTGTKHLSTPVFTVGSGIAATQAATKSSVTRGAISCNSVVSFSWSARCGAMISTTRWRAGTNAGAADGIPRWRSNSSRRALASGPKTRTSGSQCRPHGASSHSGVKACSAAATRSAIAPLGSPLATAVRTSSSRWMAG